MKQSSCTFDPSVINGALGMFHCPACGEMQIAGMPHTMILEQSDWDDLHKTLDESLQKPSNDTDFDF